MSRNRRVVWSCALLLGAWAGVASADPGNVYEECCDHCARPPVVSGYAVAPACHSPCVQTSCYERTTCFRCFHHCGPIRRLLGLCCRKPVTVCPPPCAPVVVPVPPPPAPVPNGGTLPPVPPPGPPVSGSSLRQIAPVAPQVLTPPLSPPPVRLDRMVSFPRE
jgi:hypothetical protein